MNPEDNQLIGGWLGDVRGTHIGTAFMMISPEGEGLSVEISINIGGVITRGVGASSADRKQINFVAVDAQNRPIQGSTARLTILGVDAKSIWGRWNASSGGVGVVNFVSERTMQTLAPGPAGLASPSKAPDIHKIQLVIREEELPAITLSRAQIKILLDTLISALPESAGTVVTVKVEGRTIRRFEDAWLISRDLPQELDNVFIQRNENTNGIQKIIMIQLSQADGNKIIVQGPEETWSAGTAVSIREFLAPYSSRYASWIKKHVIGVFAIILSFLITVFTPDFTKLQRVAFLVLAIVLALAVQKAGTFITRTRIILTDAETSWWQRNAANVIAGTISSVAAALLGAIVAFVGSNSFSELLEHLWSSLAR